MTIQEERMAVRYALAYVRMETERLDKQLEGYHPNKEIKQHLEARNHEMKQDMAVLEVLNDQYL